MKPEFDKFVKTFDMNEKSIQKKYNHSYRVEKLCELLTKDNSKEKIASVIGLLHDYGRFYQWTKYKTFSDKESIDHADYAVTELFEKNKIQNFYQEKEDYKKIYEAIKYHNKYSIPDNVEDRFLCEMIRDADKLDILYMYTTGELKLSEEGEITHKIKDEYYSHKLIKFEFIKTKIDRSINVLSLVYDLYLKDSYKYLKDNNIIDKIYDKIKDKAKFKDYIKEIKKHINKKLREDDKTC